MLLGHFAVGMAAKRAAPRVSLGWLFVAAQTLDLIWPVLILAGVEHVRLVPGITQVNALDLYDMPYSHSLATALLWSLLFAGLYLALERDRRGAAVLGAVVFSHWVLDFIAHRPDMQLWPGNPQRYGLGLWSSRPATIAVEVGMFLAGGWLYWQATAGKRRRGVWILFGVLLAVGIGSSFGPVPPNTTALAVSALVILPVAVLAGWLERPRA